jgi:hypothetical protein
VIPLNGGAASLGVMKATTILTGPTAEEDPNLSGIVGTDHDTLGDRRRLLLLLPMAESAQLTRHAR